MNRHNQGVTLTGWSRGLWLVAWSCLVAPCSCTILSILLAWELAVLVLSGWVWLPMLVRGSIRAPILLILPPVLSLYAVGLWSAPGRLSPCWSYLWHRASHAWLLLRMLVCVSLGTLAVLWLSNVVALRTVGRLTAHGRLSPCCDSVWQWVLHAWAIL
jgi:hypothetical protein